MVLFCVNYVGTGTGTGTTYGSSKEKRALWGGGECLLELDMEGLKK